MSVKQFFDGAFLGCGYASLLLAAIAPFYGHDNFKFVVLGFLIFISHDVRKLHDRN